MPCLTAAIRNVSDGVMQQEMGADTEHRAAQKCRHCHVQPLTWMQELIALWQQVEYGFGCGAARRRIHDEHVDPAPRAVAAYLQVPG